MGEAAETLINGEACQWCGTWFEPNETVYVPTEFNDEGETIGFEPTNIHKDGRGLGFPAVCESCAKYVEEDKE